MSYTLVVIDMQPEFLAAGFPDGLSNVKEEVKKAIANKAHILFVEYNLAGPTNPDIVKIAKNYDKAFVVTKEDDDGSTQVKRAIWKHKAPANTIKICGVNTDCCVKATVVGLCYKLPTSTIEVLEYACDSDFDHWAGIESIKKESNAVIKRKHHE